MRDSMRVAGVLGILVFAAGLAPLARATDFRLLPGGRAAGTIDVPADADRLWIPVVNGITLTITVTGKAGLLPELALFDEDGPVDLTPYLAGAGSSKVRIVGLPLDAARVLRLEVRGAGGTTGTWSATTKRSWAKATRVYKVQLTPPAQGTAQLAFEGFADGSTTLTVKPVSGSAASIGAVRIKGPLGEVDFGAALKVATTKASLKKGLLPDLGPYVLEVDNAGGGGTLSINLSLGAPKVGKKALKEPITTGSACGDGSGSCLLGAEPVYMPEIGSNGSRVMLPVDGTARVLDPAAFAAGARAIAQVPDPQNPSALLEVDAVIESIHRVPGGIEFELDRRLPTSGPSPFASIDLPPVVIRVPSGALWLAADQAIVTETVDFALPADAGTTLPRFWLACRPLITRTPERFTPLIFAGVPPLTSLPAKSPAERVTEFGALLDAAVLAGRLDAGQRDALQYAFQNGSLQGFDPTGIDGLEDLLQDQGVDLRVIAPDPALRGALLLLFLTPCEDAIAAVLGHNQTNAPFSAIAFSNPGPGEKVTTILYNGQLNILFDPTYAMGSPMLYLSGLIADRVLSQDIADSIAERAVANFAGVMATASLLRLNPGAAAAQDALVRFENDELLAFLNSGSAMDRLGLSAAPQIVAPSVVFLRAVPVAAQIDSFATYLSLKYASQFPFSAGFANPTLQAYVGAFVNAPQSGLAFDAATLSLIDQGLDTPLATEGLYDLLGALQATAALESELP